MKKFESMSVGLFVCLMFISKQAFSIEESLYQLSGNDTKEEVQKKIGKHKILEATSDLISIDFTPPQSFTVNDSDLFEKIESSSKGDTLHRELLLADPKSGRIFHLTTELKVSKLDLIKPWTSKEKPKSLKEILAGMDNTKIVRKIVKKAAVKK